MQRTATSSATFRLQASLGCVAVACTLLMLPAAAASADENTPTVRFDRQATEPSDERLASTEDGDGKREWRGVAVDLGRIDVEDVLEPGQTYFLATITVRNPGTEVSSYRMGVQAIESDAGTPPADWVGFDPETFRLEPDERKRVEVTINVPRGSEPGAYEALVAAQLASDTDGPAVGGAAASRLTFMVAPTPALPEIDPLVFGVVALGAVLALLIRFARRYSFRIERRSG